MKCLTPVTLYSSEHKFVNHWGYTNTTIVPCKKCPSCYLSRRQEWIFRLSQTRRKSSSALFLTLTYENPPITQNGHETLLYDDLRLFNMRLRKENTKYTKDKYIYYAVGEYGTNFLRPHYHIIAFNIHPAIYKRTQILENIWGKGLMDIQENPHDGGLMYTAGYILNGTWEPTQDDDDRAPEKSYKSKGIGKEYLTQSVINYHQDAFTDFTTLPNGKKYLLPEYYRKKIFNKNERQILSFKRQVEKETKENLVPTKHELEIDLIKAERRQFKKQMLNSKLKQIF